MNEWLMHVAIKIAVGEVDHFGWIAEPSTIALQLTCTCKSSEGEMTLLTPSIMQLRKSNNDFGYKQALIMNCY